MVRTNHNQRLGYLNSRILLCLVTFLVTLGSPLPADPNGYFVRQKLDLTQNGEWGKSLLSKNIEIHVDYQMASISYTQLNKKKEIIRVAKILMKDSSGIWLVGIIDKSGIRNSKNEYVKQFGDTYYSSKIIGLAEDILQYPTSPSFVILAKDGTFKETDTVFPIDLDTKERTIKEMSDFY